MRKHLIGLDWLPEALIARVVRGGVFIFVPDSIGCYLQLAES
jgi:hypothetical protein